MLKKLFDWTPSDVAAWEKIRQKGWRHFLVWYGGISFGGILFVALGGAALTGWFQSSGTAARFLFQLASVALMCLLGGFINAVLTWLVEEHLYQRYYSPHSR